MARIAQQQIPMTVCPLSNKALQTCPDLTQHPIRRMLQAGLLVTVNSDDPAMFSTTLSAQYGVLAEQGFSWEELWKLNLQTLDSTFLSPAEKAVFRKEWEDFAASLG